MVRSGLCRRQTSCDNDDALSIFVPVLTVASHIFRKSSVSYSSVLGTSSFVGLEASLISAHNCFW